MGVGWSCLDEAMACCTYSAVVVGLSSESTIQLIDMCILHRNPGGVRFGSAEIYDVVEHCFKVGSDDAGAPREHVVIDCLAVGQAIRAGADERVVLFVKLAEGCSLNDKLASLIRAEIRKRRSARHVPEKVSGWIERNQKPAAGLAGW